MPKDIFTLLHFETIKLTSFVCFGDFKTGGSHSDIAKDIQYNVTKW